MKTRSILDFWGQKLFRGYRELIKGLVFFFEIIKWFGGHSMRKRSCSGSNFGFWGHITSNLRFRSLFSTLFVNFETMKRSTWQVRSQTLIFEVTLWFKGYFFSNFEVTVLSNCQFCFLFEVSDTSLIWKPWTQYSLICF